ncbi:MAG: GNAT family N-acetyltransferase [Anaerolineae bacterium]|nr:GNAT family N-acetyltransferase [Anaerolineae bacterium]
MTEIQTQRLKLIPLTLPQLRLLPIHFRQLEQDLGYAIASDNVNDTVCRAIDIKISKMTHADERDHHWYTYWLIVITAQACGAGLAGFKGYPNKQGEVEIGYGIVSAFRNKGYITEAVQALIAWAFQYPCCAVVKAETVEPNPPSHRVLEKVGMHVYKETDKAWWWRVEKHKA